MTQPSQSITADITWDDVMQFRLFDAFGDSWLRHYRRLMVYGLWLIAALEVVVFVVIPGAESRAVAVLSFLLAVSGAAFPAQTWDSGWARSKRRHALAGVVGEHTYSLADEGLSLRANGHVSFTPWTSISRVAERRGAVYLWAASQRRFLFPATTFRSDDEVRSFVNLVEGYRGRQQPASTKLPGSVPFQSPSFAIAEAELVGALTSHPRSLAPSPTEVFWGSSTFLLAYDLLQAASLVVSLIASAVAVVAIWIALGAPGQRRMKVAFARTQLRQNPDGFAQLTIGIDERGLTEVSPTSRSEETWHAMTSIEPTTDVTYFRNNRGEVYILPVEAFSSQDEYFDFVDQSLEFRRNALAA